MKKDLFEVSGHGKRNRKARKKWRRDGGGRERGLAPPIKEKKGL